VIALEIVEGSASGRRFEYRDQLVTIGRAETNTLVLTDYHLSGEHGQIFIEGDQYIYRDLHSTNGSVVRRGESHISLEAGVNWEITLHDGDELCLGDPRNPVIVNVCIAKRVKTSAAELGDRLIASRSIVDLPAPEGPTNRSALLSSSIPHE